jgi:FKBP-type peptidyl-prolyl cis-trans isomerase
VGKQPFQFKLGVGSVIAGFDQGLVGMRVGGTRLLIIPSALGYGAAGVPGLIPPNSGLVFSVELLAVQ